jgi:hypothetical protein
MEEKMKEAKELNLLDIHLSAFLSHHGLDPRLEQINGKIVFTFPASEQVYRLMNRFNGDEDVPVASFCTKLKTLRGRMLTAKEGINENGNGENYGRRKIS